MNLTPDRDAALRALSGLGFTPADSAGLLDGSLTPMGMFDIEHRRVDCSNLTGFRHFLATSPTLKRMASQPVVGAIALGLRTWARKAAKREVLSRELVSNVITTEGLNHILSVMFAGGTQVPTWYIALFEGNYTPVIGLTAATFTASATECTAYDEATRVAFVEAAPAGGVISNSASKAVFTMNANKPLSGGALLSASAKSSTSGTCLAAARWTSGTGRAVEDGDEVAAGYSITLANAS